MLHSSNRRRLLLRLLVACCLLLAGAAESFAQSNTPQGAWNSVLEEAVSAYTTGRHDEVVDLLEPILEAEPGFRSPRHGAAAFWLGQAYAQTGDSDSAREVWLEGLDALAVAEVLDVRLADAFVRATFAQGEVEDYPRAVRLYLDLIGTTGAGTAEEAAIVRRHLIELQFVAPQAVVRRAGLDRLDEPGYTPSNDTGSYLVAWWRSRDVAPATRVNERVVEHLERVAYARRHFVFDGEFDDRGRVHIRLGAPSRKTQVHFDRTNFRNKVVDRSLTITMSDFPDNEFWFYEQIDESAQFLFYEREGEYHLGTVRDLLPPSLRGSSGGSARGQSRARAAVRTLEEIYRQLSLYHPVFANRYQDVAAFSSLLDEAELAAGGPSPQGRQIDAEDGEEEVPQVVRDAAAASTAGGQVNVSLGAGGLFSPDRPDLFLRSIIAQGQVDDEQVVARRAAYVPEVHSNAFDDAEPFPVLARSARFLEDDGTTRTEVYWGLPPGALAPSRKAAREVRRDEGIESEDYFLVGTIVQKTADYLERVVNHHRYVIAGAGRDSDVALAPQTFVATGDTGLYHLAFQWDQYPAVLNGEGVPVHLGERLKAGTFRLDSLRALTADEGRLEMSDLKPVVLDENSPIDWTDPAAVREATSYPFVRLSPEQGLALYFEVYHLTYGLDDRAHYEVEYEIRPRGRQGRGEATAARTLYESGSRTTRETILLDPGEWRARGPLEVWVRVEDQTTGQQVERVLELELVR